MRRRDLLASLGAGLVSTSGSFVRAQDAGRIYRLGMLVTAAASLPNVRSIILPELARLGFVQGRNLIVEERGGPIDRLPALARELVALRPDAILALSTPAVTALRAASDRVPIISFGPDLLALGFASSTARPGGNITGIYILGTEIEPKRLLILAEAVPGGARFGILFHYTMTRREVVLPALIETARVGGLTLFFEEVGAELDFGAAFVRMQEAGVAEILITAHSVLWSNIVAIAAAAREARMPTVCEWLDIAGTGCVLGYGPSRIALFERTAAMISQVLTGTPPGSIPIESPTHVGLAVDLKAAAAIGMTIPPSLLARADGVTE